jgi:hypothetical protein
MLCDKYKEALIEAAANAAALPNSVRDHVDACARCNEMLAAEQKLFAMMEERLRSRVNVPVPANFDHRVRAALPAHVSLQRRSYLPLFAWGSVGAALMIGITLMQSVKPSKNEPQTSAVQSGPSVPEQQSTIAASAVDRSKFPAKRYPRMRAFTNSQRPEGRGIESDQPDVLVPPGQQDLLVKYMEEVSARKTRAMLSASSPHELEMKPIEVLPVEISQLVVKPLPDLSSN